MVRGASRKQKSDEELLTTYGALMWEAIRAFSLDARYLAEMVEDADRLEKWPKNIGGHDKELIKSRDARMQAMFLAGASKQEIVRQSGASINTVQVLLKGLTRGGTP